MVKIYLLVVIFIFSSSARAQLKDDYTLLADRSATGSPSDEGWRTEKKSFTPYRIITSRYVARSTVTKSINQENCIRLRIMQNGKDNPDIEDLSIITDSGNEYRMSNVYGVENYSLPLYVKVTYRVWNTFHAVQSDVTFEFVIFAPGTWNVNLHN